MKIRSRCLDQHASRGLVGIACTTLQGDRAKDEQMNGKDEDGGNKREAKHRVDRICQIRAQRLVGQATA